MTNVTVNGVRLACRVAGQGAPLLLLHGFTGTGATWSRQLPGLERTHRTISVDLLGHGRSEAPADPSRYAVERQAHDLAVLLTSLDATPADVVGYSMGARIALRLVIDHPASVDRLVLESPSAGLLDGDERASRRASDERQADRLEADGIETFVDAWESQAMFSSHAKLSSADRAQIRHERLSHHPVGLANVLRGAGQGAMEPLHDRLGEIVRPSLVVAGQLDRIGCERATEVAANIPAARLESVRGAGHTPHIERPKDFGRLLATFLTSDSTKPH